MPEEIIAVSVPRSQETLAGALASPRAVVFAGHSFSVKPLTFNKLVEIEDAWGPLDTLNMNSLAVQRSLVSIILSTSEKAVTEDEVGEMLTVDDLRGGSELITDVLHFSGLLRSEDEPAKDAEPKDDGGKKDTGRKTASRT